MTKKILAFGASSSRKSINKRLANYTAHQLENAEVTLLDLNDFEMPIFSVDKEAANGIPQLAHDFKAYIKNTDALIISFAEHNGAYTAAFKNIFDWISRIEHDVWANNPMFLLATSLGGRGAITVLDIAVNKFKRMTEKKVVSFSLPSFKQNFSDEGGISDAALNTEYRKQLADFSAAL